MDAATYEALNFIAQKSPGRIAWMPEPSRHRSAQRCLFATCTECAKGEQIKRPVNNRERSQQLNLAPAFRNARLFCLLRTLLLPTFNLNEPVQTHCSSAPENRMHLCETRGACLMPRHPLHSQEILLHGELTFHGWAAANSRRTSATTVPPSHALPCTWHTLTSCASRSTSCKLPYTPGDAVGDGSVEWAASARLRFSLLTSNFQDREKRTPDALWCVSFILTSNCSVGLYEKWIHEHRPPWL